MILASVLVFGVMNVFIKALADTYPINQVTFFRCAFALIPVLGAIAWANHGALLPTLRTRRQLGHFARAGVGLLSMLMTFWSLHLLPLGDAVALNFSAPLFLTILSVPLLAEKVGVHRWSAVLVGFVGVLVIVRPSSEMLLQAGALVALAGAFFQAFAMVAIRQLSRTEPPNTIVFYFTTWTTVLLAGTLPFSWVTPSWPDLAMLAAAGLLGGVAQLFMTRAYALAPVAVISPFTYSSLVFAVIFGFLFWGEMPTLNMLAGAIVVIASGLYILHRETRKTAPLQKPPSSEH